MTKNNLSSRGVRRSGRRGDLFNGRLPRSLWSLAMTLLLLLFLIPNSAQAQCVASCPAGQVAEGECPDPSCGEGVSCAPWVTCAAATSEQPPADGGSSPPPPASTALQLPNPLGTANVPVIVGRIIKTLSGGAGMIALLMFVYGGFQWLTSGGNAEKIKKGQAIILWSLIGLVVMFSSYIAARYIIETLVPTATR